MPTLAPVLIRRILLLAAIPAGIAVLAASVPRFPSMYRHTVPIPAGTARLGSREPGGLAPFAFRTDSFRMGRHPVTTGMYLHFLREAGQNLPLPEGIRRTRNGRLRMARGETRRPVAGISRDEAEAFCHWLALRWDADVRLPTEAEWEYAARGGIAGGRYPWGWGDPRGHVPAGARRRTKVGRHPPNAFGLFDLAGPVFEWCAPSPDAPEEGLARGRSWAERDPRFRRVFHRTPFPPAYRGDDLGFRLIVGPLAK